MKLAVPVYSYPDAVKAFVAQGIFEPGRQFGNSTAIGFADDTGLVAGFVYHNYEPSAGVIEVSGFSTRRDWVSAPLLRIIFEYPFNQLGVRLVVARHSEKNTRVRRIWKALGATEHVIPELRGPGEAEAIAILSAQDWANSKFMRRSNGKA